MSQALRLAFCYSGGGLKVLAGKMGKMMGKSAKQTGKKEK